MVEFFEVLVEPSFLMLFSVFDVDLPDEDVSLFVVVVLVEEDLVFSLLGVVCEDLAVELLSVVDFEACLDFWD